MPTIGWVHEDSWESILTATERVPEPSKARPPLFHCPFCSQAYKNSGELQAHIASAHHVARPVLLIAGQEPNHGFVLRKAPIASGVALMNTTRLALSINNDPFQIADAQEVWRTLAKLTMARVKLELENARDKNIAPVKTNYEITIRVAAPSNLLAVERAFNEHLNVASFTTETVTTFLADPRCQGVASDYATGMAEYALGILNKEGRQDAHIATPLARYRDHFGSALLKLSPHQRALPRLISAFMRFSLNDFSHAGEATGHVGLDAAIATLAGPKAGKLSAAPSGTGSLRNLCPIDHGTDRILNFADRLATASRWSPVLNDECRDISNAAKLDLMDQEKATALWALAALRHGATAAAIEPLERIAATYPFAEWASYNLDAVTE